MLKTVGNRPTTGGGVPVELGFGEAGGDHPAVCFDRLELLEHVLKFQGHLVILGDHPVCRGGRGSHREHTVFFIVAACCNTFAGRPSPHSCCCCPRGCERKRCPTRWSAIRRTRSRTSDAIRGRRAFCEKSRCGTTVHRSCRSTRRPTHPCAAHSRDRSSNAPSPGLRRGGSSRRSRGSESRRPSAPPTSKSSSTSANIRTRSVTSAPTSRSARTSKPSPSRLKAGGARRPPVPSSAPCPARASCSNSLFTAS